MVSKDSVRPQYKLNNHLHQKASQVTRYKLNLRAFLDEDKAQQNKKTNESTPCPVAYPLLHV
jgi:hypothetical protein